MLPALVSPDILKATSQPHKKHNGCSKAWLASCADMQAGVQSGPAGGKLTEITDDPSDP